MKNIILLKSYITRIEADMDANFLRSHGIEVIIQSDDCGGVSPGLTISNRIKLFIRQDDLDKAKELLNPDS